jgi:hypothetical protein
MIKQVISAEKLRRIIKGILATEHRVKEIKQNKNFKFSPQPTKESVTQNPCNRYPKMTKKG